LGAWAAAYATLSAQQLLPSSEGVVRPLFSDIAILQEEEARKDLPCTVTSIKPALGFDFRFRSGYEVTVPLKELADEAGRLTMVFRVIPASHPDQPVYLSQHVPVPEIEEDAKGDADLQGVFSVGEGKYHVSWLMRDRTERVCSSSWDIEAGLPLRDKAMPLDIAPEAVLAADLEPFRVERPVLRTAREGALHVKVMVNFAPQESSSAVLQPADTEALLSILRSIARDPRVEKFSLVVFNMQEQRVIYRQEKAPQIDFPGLGKAVKTLNLGKIDVKQLAQKHGDAEFLADLMTKEIKGNQDQPDAVIIAGPKAAVDDSLPPDALKQLGEVKFPLFYMNYNLDPTVNPWRDAIGAAVRALKGAEYTITRPRDVFFSWSEIAGRIMKSKFGKSAAAGGILSQ
jgi:hypothetical protein